MIDLTTAKNTNERLALTLIKSMEEGTLIEAIGELCTEDFEWTNSGLPSLKGQKEIISHLESGGFQKMIPILKEMTSFTSEVNNLASFGQYVYTERVDHHWNALGQDLMTPIVSGVLEIRGGHIASLHDFYDTACYEQEPTNPQENK